jgi:hypothetical protein
VNDKIQNLTNIVVHEKDRHLIECAYVADKIIISYENFDKESVKNDLDITILHPSQYLKQSKPN